MPSNFSPNKRGLISATIESSDITFVEPNGKRTKFTGFVNNWIGKKWVAVGSTITKDGKYTKILEEISGMVLTNMGNDDGRVSVIGQDLDSVDANLITIEVGLADFKAGTPIGSLGDTTPATFYGGLYRLFTQTFAADPKRTIIVLTPYGNTDNTPKGNYLIPNCAGIHLHAYAKAIRDVASWLGIAIIDVGGESGIGGLNGSEYYSDGFHLNDIGAKKYAEFVWSKLIQIK